MKFPLLYRLLKKSRKSVSLVNKYEKRAKDSLRGTQNHIRLFSDCQPSYKLGADLLSNALFKPQKYHFLVRPFLKTFANSVQGIQRAVI